ncbi:MAG: hypothetical protein JWO82_3154 [Akkermansiaceae bacterium]|nr:hypothetical protein [Akkermansiaceae bacterium]
MAGIFVPARRHFPYRWAGPRSPSSLKRYIQLHFLVLLLAATALLGRGISLSSLGVVTWRTALACLGAALWTGFLRPRLTKGEVRPAPLWPGAGQALRLIGVGAVIGIHWLCFFGSVKLSNISICLLALTTMSLFTAFTEPFFEKRRVRPFEVLLGILIVCGIGIAAKDFNRHDTLGLIVGLGAAFLAAIFPVLNRRIVQAGGDPQVMVAWEMLGACAVTLIVLPFFSTYGELFAWKGLDWLWLLLLAWVCTVFAHGFHIHLLRFFSAYTLNLAINFEPIYGVIAAALCFSEYKDLTGAFYAGMLTTIAANLLHPVIIRWNQRRKGLVLESDPAEP